MPPQSPIPNENEDRLLPRGQKSSAGPVVGIIIIVVVMVIGALYFWSARGGQQGRQDQLPLILPDNSTTSTSTLQ